MKEAILISKGDHKQKNIGDYIQSIAGKAFMKNTTVDIEREEIDLFQSEEPVKCILNGWYMEHPEHWPPSKYIVPLLISIHINKTKAEALFANGGATYMMEHGPVGCRDRDTLRILETQGIPGYYSSCLTLTLGEQYKRAYIDKKKVIFVDAFCSPYRNEDGRLSARQALGSLFYYLRNIRIARAVLKKYNYGEIDVSSLKGFVKALLYVGRFVEVYKSKFSADILLNATYISHSVSKEHCKNVEDMYQVADNFLKEYASAALVVTSRLHCALPCLGMETPVIFIKSKATTTEDESLAPLSTGRFDGIYEFLNCIEYKGNSLVENKEFMFGSIDYVDLPKMKNKTKHNKYKDLLITKCTEFAQNDVLRST